MKTISKFAIATVLAVSSAAVVADELVVTTEKSGRANVAGLDYVSSGRATGLEFRLKVPNDATVDTSKCLAQIPKSHAGVCKFNNVEGYVVGMVFSDTNALLPKGLVSIGSITVTSKAPITDAFEVLHFLAADVSAQPIEAAAKVMREGDTKQ